MFPETNENSEDFPDIPETWKRFDSFKFDRSIEKAEDTEYGITAKKLENRDAQEDKGKH